MKTLRNQEHRSRSLAHATLTAGNSRLCGALVLLMMLASLSVSTLRADTVYNNSTNDIKVRFDTAAREVGDEIILAGTARYLTNFSFEYWGTSQAGAFAAAEVRVRFYLNDGPEFNGYSTPGTMFYDSDWFEVRETERRTLVYTAGVDFPVEGLWIPETNFTWSVQFQGLAVGDAAGVDIYSPIVVGEGYPDYWEHAINGWQLKTNYTAPMNFAAVFQASTVPAVRPNLEITKAPEDRVVLSWPTWATGYAPEWTADLTAGNWTTLNQPVFTSGDNFVMTNTPPGTVVLYRLHRP